MRDVQLAYAGDSIIVVGTRWAPQFVLSVGGSALTEPRLTYASSDTTVIAVRGDSLVALRRGRSTIAATVLSAVLPGSAPSVFRAVQTVAKAVTLDRSSVTFTALGDTTSLVATVLDLGDHPMPLAVVSWSSSDTTIVTVSSQGKVLARKNGTVGVRAIVDFDTATAQVVVKQTATAMQIAGGNNQTGATHQNLSQPLSVKVTDAGGNPIPGVGVTFTVTSGGGTLNGGSATVANVVTDAGGLAQATLKLGATPGQTTVSATGTSTSLGTVVFTETAT